MSPTPTVPTNTSNTESSASVPTSNISTRPSTTSTADPPIPPTASSTQATQGSHKSSSPGIDANSSSASNISQSNNNESAPSTEEDYPEQRHAGAVGYGPNYRQGATLSDKISGLKEELKGKVTKNPELVEHGKEKKTGDLKRKELEEDMNNMDPFQTAADDDNKDEEDNNSGKNTSPADRTTTTSNTGQGHTSASSTAEPKTSQPNTSSAFGTGSTSAPPQPAQPVETHSLASNAKRDAQGHDVRNTTGESVDAPAGAVYSGSGMDKPRDIKQIDERNTNDNDHTHTEPGQIARDAVQV
ncbi:hypothetical protein DFH05DRAFT_1516698 [Lentinula detonsa]|uniref:Proteophosphoglycan ppg4 n=1 Tax=Lentinula detonsa TaxID=2804962 RepID=A0A9W8NQ44_9AGAR|nr:hypothetical protein DFH05DRAFT_1516698 [Lentinula detonsa]